MKLIGKTKLPHGIVTNYSTNSGSAEYYYLYE